MINKSVFLIISVLVILIPYVGHTAKIDSRTIAQTAEEPAGLKGEVAPGDETVPSQQVPGSTTQEATGSATQEVTGSTTQEVTGSTTQETEIPLPNGEATDPQQSAGEEAPAKEPEFKTVLLKTTDHSKNSKAFVDLNNQGLAELKAKNYYTAVEKFAAALGLNPYSAEVQINFAIALENLGKTEEALRALQSSAKISDNPEVKFISEYNQGVLLSKGEDKDQAISHYQNALDINPESFETKVNIELLTGENGGKGKSDKQDKDQKDNQDKKDKGDGKENEKDQKDPKGKDKGEDPKEDQPKKYGKKNPQPKPFKSEELTQGDVNKILNELRQQEQKIRAEFNKKIIKEKPRDKDW